MTRFLLDTHVLIWWIEENSELPARMKRFLKNARDNGPLFLSDISLWEIAVLAQFGRIRLHLPLRDWLERASAPPLVQRVGISPAIAAESTALPRHFHRDPADRILVATARVLGIRLMTCDAQIIRAKVVDTV